MNPVEQDRYLEDGQQRSLTLCTGWLVDCCRLIKYINTQMPFFDGQTHYGDGDEDTDWRGNGRERMCCKKKEWKEGQGELPGFSLTDACSFVFCSAFASSRPLPQCGRYVRICRTRQQKKEEKGPSVKLIDFMPTLFPYIHRCILHVSTPVIFLYPSKASGLQVYSSQTTPHSFSSPFLLILLWTNL